MGIPNRLSALGALLWMAALEFSCATSARVVLTGNNATLSFAAVEANFALPVKGSGVCGVLYLADPIDACSQLVNEVTRLPNASSPFALIVRGGCGFEDKVRTAQKAGFKAAIVYDNKADGGLVPSMAGNSAGIKIHSVFVSEVMGKLLQNYAGSTNVELCIIPSFEDSAWSIMAISFISLLAISAVLAMCFFVRRHRIRRERLRAPCVREFHGMSSRLVKVMPSLIFTAVLEDNCTSRTCAICLEDYNVGEKLRILPCHHKFHALCVDSWLTWWRTFCPVCKHDARTSTGEPPASESTPLVSSSPSSVASSSALSSARSSVASSSAIQIARASHYPSASWTPSLSSTSLQQSHRSYGQSPPLSSSRSSESSDDLRNASSPGSRGSYLVSAFLLGYPSISPVNSTFGTGSKFVGIF